MVKLIFVNCPFICTKCTVYLVAGSINPRDHVILAGIDLTVGLQYSTHNISWFYNYCTAVKGPELEVYRGKKLSNANQTWTTILDLLSIVL